jgi:hypothetical protein
VTRLSQPRFLIACFTTPSLSRSRDQATAFDSTPISSPSTFDQKRTSTRLRRRKNAAGRQERDPTIKMPADHGGHSPVS